MKLDKLVEKHLTLTNDDLCDCMGHELISRACVHCGLTIHQIADANNGVLPMRESPQERRELRSHLKRRIADAQAIITEAEGLLDASPEIEDEADN
jgi:hypothetical protein